MSILSSKSNATGWACSLALFVFHEGCTAILGACVVPGIPLGHGVAFNGRLTLRGSGGLSAIWPRVDRIATVGA